VLVPLCGKSLDLAFLATQPEVSCVTGVELIQKALDEFAKEHPELHVRPTGQRTPLCFPAAASKDGKLLLLRGDILALPATPTYTHVWDRASLVAMDPKDREAYVRAVSEAVVPGGRYLLSALTREAGPIEARVAGPPFSVSEADVRKLYGGSFRIRRLETTDALASNPRLKAQGLTAFTETTYLLVKR
jgi:thiopurine S-methyltransferase